MFNSGLELETFQTKDEIKQRDNKCGFHSTQESLRESFNRVGDVKASAAMIFFFWKIK